MGRVKGSGSVGPVRSTRLPQALDDWFAQKCDVHREKSSSQVLVSLIHGGLRLRDGYMAVHRRTMEHYLETNDRDRYATYCRCLLDSFGREYLEHLERWLEADGIAIVEPDAMIEAAAERGRT